MSSTFVIVVFCFSVLFYLILVSSLRKELLKQKTFIHPILWGWVCLLSLIIMFLLGDVYA